MKIRFDKTKLKSQADKHEIPYVAKGEVFCYQPSSATQRLSTTEKSDTDARSARDPKGKRRR